jgi:hypothetical protein
MPEMKRNSRVREIDPWTKKRLLVSGRYESLRAIGILERYASTFADKEGALLLLDQAVLFLKNEQHDFTLKQLIEILKEVVPQGDRSALEAAISIIRENAPFSSLPEIGKMLIEKRNNGGLKIIRNRARHSSIDDILNVRPIEPVEDEFNEFEWEI